MKRQVVISAVALLLMSTSLSASGREYRVASGKIEEVESKERNDCVFILKEDSILEFDGLRISQGEKVQFQQNSADSWNLVRIVSKEPVKISGDLEANGHLLLSCPSGFDVDGKIEGAGLIVTTRDISNKNFLSDGKWEFADEGGKIFLSGKISATESNLYLFADEIKNEEGSVTGPSEMVAITSKGASLDMDEKKGTTYGVFFNNGKIQANSIHIHSKDLVNLGKISANGDGGSVELVANSGLLLNKGEVKARSGEYGGHIQMRGKEVAFTNNAKVDVCGALGGGDVTILGDVCNLSTAPLGYEVIVKGETVYKGPPLSVEETDKIIRQNKLIGALKPLFKADALVDGDGGTITIKADKQQNFGAKVLARGKGADGVGGILELCSGGGLNYGGSIDMKAASGKNGRLLLDPKYAIISPIGTDSATGNTFASNSSDSVTISGADLETALNSASVIIQANTDITFADTVVATTSGNGLTLQAGRSITFTSNGDLTLNNGAFSATINDVNAVSDDREAGNAMFHMNDNSRIFTQGGDITVAISNFTGSFEGKVAIGNAIVEALGGNIDITGTGFSGLSNESGIRVVNGTISTSLGGAITLTGAGGAGVNNNIGVYLTGKSTQVINTTGTTTFTGTGGAGSGASNQGIRIESGASVVSTTGNIDVTGDAGSGTDWCMGVILTGTDSEVSTADGDMTFTGTASGTGQLGQGVRLEIGSIIKSTGTGTITVDGTASPGLANCTGVCVSGDGSIITSVNGNILVTGVGDSDGTSICDQGVRLESRGKITSTGSGAGAATITVVGVGGAGTDHNDGVILSGSGAVIESIDGDISVTGTGAGTGDQNQGIRCEAKGSILSTGAGANAANITATGTGADGDLMNNGVLLIGLGSLIDAVDGDIDVTGTAQGTGPTEGVSEQGGTINSANGTVTITSNDVI